MDPKVDQLNHYLSRFSYKPNFKFKAYRKHIEYDLIVLDIEMTVPHRDTLDPTKVITQRALGFRDVPKNELEFAQWMREIIRHLEMHEVDEWVKMDGLRIFDPHEETKPISRVEMFRKGLLD